ncbi:pyridine nucleotide-disulfide oxidoreductase [Myroides marinus]|uniref:Pyridine nucleotide-disulfide oxidoreductase n=1 Tax=Myroides marinus TaxID=703342 RepID=A0A161SAU4_9FLAO|nr:FAD-dependent oxidoreductase [Myroides marinus]KUF44415.1 pyridine nucleotide-disulfide oxidoreductase [Myroides marinus]KZE82814.1 pyridine nucleotide-disulfide oxidoreductase [Myroides marinus]
MEVFDVLIIGGGVSGVSCAQVLGSAVKKPFAADKKIGIIMHQKASMLQDAVFYNAYGVKQGTLGCDLLSQSIEDLKYYSHINQILEEKVTSVLVENDVYRVTTNKQEYFTKIVVVAVNSSATFSIEGLLDYVEPHKKSLASKNRIQLKNIDHFVTEGIYVVGTLAGHRSQLAIAAGSGAAVATDILTLWNDGIETHSHDSNRVK